MVVEAMVAEAVVSHPLVVAAAYSVGEEDIIVMCRTWMPDSREGTACDECIEGYRTP